MFVMCFLCASAFQESVRKAADLTLKTLSKVTLFVTVLARVFIPVCLYMCMSDCLNSRSVQVCTRMCESTGSAAQRTVAVMLPTLLEKGIVSNVTEVRSLR